MDKGWTIDYVLNKKRPGITKVTKCSMTLPQSVGCLFRKSLRFPETVKFTSFASHSIGLRIRLATSGDKTTIPAVCLFLPVAASMYVYITI